MKERVFISLRQLTGITFKKFVRTLKRHRNHLRHKSVKVEICSVRKKRFKGYKKIDNTCNKVLSEPIIINGINGVITIYAEGYVVFRYYDSDTCKDYYTVLDLLYDKHTDNSVVSSRPFTVNISAYNSIDAYSVIITEIENNIEYNTMRRDQYRNATSYRDDLLNNYDYDYDYDNSYYNDGDNLYTGNPIDTVISETTEPDNTRQEIKAFFYQKMSSLTPMQSKVLKLLLKGYSQKEIAKELGKSESAICQCKRRIFAFYQTEWNASHPDYKVPITH